jgi:transmembrane sensor
MTQATRIPTLLFLHSRNELSKAEEMELAGWRAESKENEQLFREISDPEYVRVMMSDLYKSRERVFEKLKAEFPNLSNAKLSNQAGYEPGPDYDFDDVEERQDFPEKHIMESGLSKADFWASWLEEMQIEEDEEPDAESRVEEPSGVYKTIKTRTKRPGRSLRIFLRVAAVLVITLGVFLFTANSGSNRFQALMISPYANKSVLDDFHRGFLAGRAHITFEKTLKGEPVYVFSNHAEAVKNENFTLETSNGNEFILKLPDGTQVWMGAQSSINFPANFSQDTINLKVGGEIYFESSASSGKHFVISTVNRQPSTVNGQRSTVNLHVSSASFLFTAYPKDSRIRIGLMSGTALVQWGSQSANQTLPLQAGQQVSFFDGKILDNSLSDKTEIMALKNGEIYFKDADIRYILSTISRWYDVDIQNDGGFPDKKFSLHVPIGTDLSVIGDSLKKQEPRILVHGKTITVFK